MKGLVAALVIIFMQLGAQAWIDHNERADAERQANIEKHRADNCRWYCYQGERE